VNNWNPAGAPIEPVTWLVFWANAGAVLYTLFGYRLLIQAIARLRPRPHVKGDCEPNVTLIIAAHNSERSIAKKIENSLALDYPRHKLEIVVASDNSTDFTDEIVSSYQSHGVQLVAVIGRRGKHFAQKEAVDRTCGEIVLFTDAGITLEPGAVRSIARNFADASVACVSSEDEFHAESTRTGESAYVDSEMQLRRWEAMAGSIVGATGAFFAARRVICDKWHRDQSSDFFVPLHAVEAGFRAVVDPETKCRYANTPSARGEFERKVRTIVHGLVVFTHHLYLLDIPRFGLFSVQFVSHKLMRWLLPVFLFSLLVASVLLAWFHPSMALVVVIQLAGYAIGGIALRHSALHRFTVFKLAAFFVLSIAATVVAWVKYLTGEKYVIWEPTKR
jgi:glycosyltransferase involved in cell wall biosynthesis